jgi:hypothetical protein
MKRFYGCVFLFVAAITGVFQCSRMGLMAGNSSSETTNGVVAAVCGSDGSPAAGASVRLRRSDYVTQPPVFAKPAITGADALTDAQGRFHINGIDKGTYSVEVSTPSTGSHQGGAVLLSCSLDVQDTVNFSTDTLRPFAAVRGTIDTSGMSDKQLFVQVFGLERLVSIESGGEFLLNDLPAGLFSLRIIAVVGSQITVLFTEQVTAISGDTVSIPMAGWNFAKKLFLNTTASGANISGNVVDFPVLIRLNSGTISFSDAKSEGEDLRFTKSDGTPLPYEIERWDASQGSAELWVRVDTVFGNDSTHFINMYWGNASAAAASNGAVVFDTANGFQGVWHLNESTGQPAKDATANHFDGTPSSAAPAAVSGTIGLAQHFNGISNYLQMRGTAGSKLNFSETDTFAVSAWVYADTLVDSTSHMIVGKGHQQYYLKLFFGPQGQHWEFTEYIGDSVWHITNYVPAVAKSWKYLFGIREGNTQYLYLDGALVNSNTMIADANAPRDTSNDVTIGRYLQFVTQTNQGYAFFEGIIDEVRISNVSRSADWIKLCFMNQKAVDKLVRY